MTLQISQYIRRALSAGLASPLQTRNCGGILWQRAIFSSLVTSANAEVTRSSRFVCQSFRLSFRLSVSSITAAVISRFHWNSVLWLDLPIERVHYLFDGDPVPDTYSGSLYHFPRHCGIRDFRRFISISHTQSPADFHDTRRNDWRQQGSESITVGSDPADIRIQIRINPGIRIRIPDHFWFRLWLWRRFALFEHGVSFSVLL